MGFGDRFSGTSGAAAPPSSGGFGSRFSAPTPAPSKGKKGGGGFLHRLARDTGLDVAAHLGQDVGNFAVGFGPGVVQLGKSFGLDEYHALKDPVHGSDYITGKKSLTRKNIVDPTAKSYEQTYGPLVHGHVGEFLHGVGEHPLGPILDALTLADLGSTSAARVGLLDTGRAELALRSPAAAAGQEGGHVVTKLSSTKPLVRGRQVLTNKALAKLRYTTPVIGEGVRYGREIRRTAVREGLKEMPAYRLYVHATKKLNDREWAALNLIPRDVHPADLAEYWKGTQNEAIAADPKIASLITDPSPRLKLAVAAARNLSEQGAGIFRKLGLLNEDTAAARPAAFRERVSAKLERPVEPLHGQPFYLPDTARPTRSRDPFAGLGGGKGQPRLPGAAKQNRGIIQELGKLNLQQDILGSEFLSRIKLAKHADVHRALLDSSIKMTPDELDHFLEANGGLPHTVEYIRPPVVSKTDTQLERPGQISALDEGLPRPVHTAPSRLEVLPERVVKTERQMTQVEAETRLKKLEREWDKGLNDLRGLLFGKVDQGEVNFRTRENKRAAQQATGRRADGSLSGSRGRKSIKRPTVVDEQMALAERHIQDFVAKNPDMPVSKKWQARIEEIEALRRGLNPELFEEPVLPTVSEESRVPGGVRLKPGSPSDRVPVTRKPTRRVQYEGTQLVGGATQRVAGLRQAEAIRGATTPQEIAALLHRTDLDRRLGDDLGTGSREEAHFNGVHYYLAPKATIKAATGEFHRTSTIAHNLIERPLSAWRSIILGLRVGFLTNNIVGNNLIYAIRTAGLGGLRAYLHAVLEQKGPSVVSQLIHDPETSAKLGNRVTKQLMDEFFPEQVAGTFGRTQSPILESRVPSRATKIGKHARLGIMPATQAIAEDVPRRALVEVMLKKSPEFKAVYRGLPRQTRTFEEAARKALSDQSPAYQRTISDEVNNVLGDYLNLGTFERTIVRNVLPFYSWYKAITHIAAHLATDTPGRALIVARLGQIGAEWDQKKLGDVPSYLKGAIPLGPERNGQQSVLATAGLNPFVTLDQLGRGFSADVGQLGLSPFIQTPLDEYARTQKYGGHVPGLGQLLAQSGKDFAKNLPLSQLASPSKPSKLYPKRTRRTQELAFVGAPIKTYDVGEAHRRGKAGQ